MKTKNTLFFILVWTIPAYIFAQTENSVAYSDDVQSRIIELERAKKKTAKTKKKKNTYQKNILHERQLLSKKLILERKINKNRIVTEKKKTVELKKSIKASKIEEKKKNTNELIEKLKNQKRLLEENKIAEKLDAKEKKYLKKAEKIALNKALKEAYYELKKERLTEQNAIKEQKEVARTAGIVKRIERKKVHQIQISQIITSKIILKREIYREKRIKTILNINRLKEYRKFRMEHNIADRKRKKENHLLKIYQIKVNSALKDYGSEKYVRFDGEVVKSKN